MKPFHPLADCMPMLCESEMIELSDDIKKNGMNHSITLFEDMILDGRNRAVACKRACINPKYRQFEGDFEQATAFVISENISRRHLTPTQKATSAVRLAEVHGERLREEALKRKSEAGSSHSGNQYTDKMEDSQKIDYLPSTQKACPSVEISEPEPPPHKQDNAARTTAKLAAMTGANRQYVHDAEKIKEEAPELFEQMETGEKTISQAKREINHRTLGTGENEWYTPEKYINLAVECLGGIDLDPASSEFANKTVGAVKFFDIEDDGLGKEWHGRIWLNPPYSQPAIMRFSEKVVSEFGNGNIESAIVLTHNYTDTAWFQLLAEHAKMICFTRGRIKFENSEGKKAAPTQGQAFFYFGEKHDLFNAVFSPIGFIARLKNVV